MRKRGKSELEDMKLEVAREFGIDIERSGGEKLSSAESGRVGGQMVHGMIEDYRRQHSQFPMQ